MADEVELARRESVLTVTLNRPEKRNAMSASMLHRLAEVFRSLGAEKDVRVVVVRGAGRSFCAGLDLAEMAAARAAGGTVRITEIEDVFHALERVPQPTIAAVQGDAIAGGCELSLHCDLRIAAEDARFSMPLAKLGLGLPLPLINKLVDAVGSAHTKELFFTGDAFPAKRALELHLVNRVVPNAELDAAAFELAERISRNAPLSIRLLKQTIFRANAFRRTIEHEDLDREVAGVAASDDVKEGVAAMREKRPPRFQGR